MTELDELTALQIELAAVSACCERRDFDPLLAPGSQMTDNDYRAGIREVFADDETWEDWMVDPLLAMVKRQMATRDALMVACSAWLDRGVFA